MTRINVAGYQWDGELSVNFEQCAGAVGISLCAGAVPENLIQVVPYMDWRNMSDFRDFLFTVLRGMPDSQSLSDGYLRSLAEKSVIELVTRWGTRFISGQPGHGYFIWLFIETTEGGDDLSGENFQVGDMGADRIQSTLEALMLYPEFGFGDPEMEKPEIEFISTVYGQEVERIADDCPICLCSMLEGVNILTACGHRFDQVCLVRWMVKETSDPECPICKSKLQNWVD